MIYEFIATIAAGFGMAGVALLLRHLGKLAKIQTPKWLTPVFAAIGIFAFQIHQEYHWYQQQVSQLPAGFKVVKTIQDTAWFRPWSYVKPQTVRFMAVDVGNARPHNQFKDYQLVNLYLFERRMSVRSVPQVIDCKGKRRADYVYPATQTPVLSNLPWVSLTEDDTLLHTLLQAVCE